MKKLLFFFRKLFGVTKILNRISSSNERVELLLDKNYKMGLEILSALKFNSTINESEWFLYKNISPGESAIDYCFCYTLYRVLSSVRPENILEFGLGQSSKMVHQFAHRYNHNAITVEHDKDWYNFFKLDLADKYPINVQLLDLEEILYKGQKAISYKNCHTIFSGEKYDLIIVDGPFGYSPDTVYSRPQIIELVTDCLADNFVIIMDDYNRKGEQNTIKEVLDYFDHVNIPYVKRVYSASKQHILITTPKLKFLTTL